MPGTVVLRLDRLTLDYGNRRAIDGLTLDCKAGEIVGLLGPNGSGKSTTMALAAGVLVPLSGTVEINGLSPRRHRTTYAKHVGYVPQEIALYEELTLKDNLFFFGGLFGIHGKKLQDRARQITELVGLSDRYDSRVCSLSGGMQRRVNLACALIHEPTVILLDEPTAALDPSSRQLLYETLHRLRCNGRTILFTTHHMDEAEHWCDRIAILHQGRLQALGRPDELGRQSRRMIVEGKLWEEISESIEASIRERLSADIAFNLDGRSFELVASDAEAIGYSLTVMQAEGAEVESFRTQCSRLEDLCAGSRNSDRSADPGFLVGGS